MVTISPALDDPQSGTNETRDPPVLTPSTLRNTFLSLSSIIDKTMTLEKFTLSHKQWLIDCYAINKSGPYVSSGRDNLGSIVQESEQIPRSLMVYLPSNELEVSQYESETEKSQGARNRMGVQLTAISNELKFDIPTCSPPVINTNLPRQQQDGWKKRKLNIAMSPSSQKSFKRSHRKSPPNFVPSVSDQSMLSAPAHDDSLDDIASARATDHNNNEILGGQQPELRDSRWADNYITIEY